MVDDRSHNTAVNLFISYSHKDEERRQELEAHLSSLRRQGLISAWHDRKIVAGEPWAEKIDEALEAAQVVLLLVSSDFINSNYCYEREMQRAMERRAEGLAIVVAIIVRSCDWKIQPLNGSQVLPRDGKAVTSWTNHDEAWTDVAMGIRRVISDLAGRRATPSRPAGGGGAAQPRFSLPHDLKFTDRRMLADALGRCGALSTPEGLNRLIDHLPREVAERMTRSSERLDLLLSLVQKCLSLDGAWQRLMEMVRNFEGESHHWRQFEQLVIELGEQSIGDKLSERLIFHHCDRNDQVDDFELGFTAHLEKRSTRRPLVFVVNGAEIEEHDLILHRLKETSLPQQLSGALDTAVRRVDFSEPPKPSAGQDEYWKKLASKLRITAAKGGYGTAIRDEMLRDRSHLLVEMEYYDTEFRQRERPDLSSFMDFWSSWPEPEHDRMVICLLSLKRGAGSSDGGGEADWLSEWAADYARRTAGDKQAATLVVLSRLRPIESHDAKRWCRHLGPEIRHDVLDRIYNFYLKNGDRPIPMRTLINEVRGYLRSASIA